MLHHLSRLATPGPTVLEVFNTLLRQLRLSIDYALTGSYDCVAGVSTKIIKEHEERMFQEAVIKTIGGVSRRAGRRCGLCWRVAPCAVGVCPVRLRDYPGRNKVTLILKAAMGNEIYLLRRAASVVAGYRQVALQPQPSPAELLCAGRVVFLPGWETLRKGRTERGRV